LRLFNNFDKIEGSEYFLYLLRLVIDNHIPEEELEEIKSFPVPVDLGAAVESLNKLHDRWIKSQVEISAIFNKTDENILSLLIKKQKGGSDC